MPYSVAAAADKGERFDIQGHLMSTHNKGHKGIQGIDSIGSQNKEEYGNNQTMGVTLGTKFEVNANCKCESTDLRCRDVIIVEGI